MGEKSCNFSKLCYSNIVIDKTLKNSLNNSLPGQSRSLQEAVSNESPIHVPRLHTLRLICIPLSQVLSQEENRPHSPHLPEKHEETKWKKTYHMIVMIFSPFSHGCRTLCHDVNIHVALYTMQLNYRRWKRTLCLNLQD